MSVSAPEQPAINGAELRFGIAAARFNPELVDGLLARVLETLRNAGVKETGLAVVRVPGSHEVPWAAHTLATGSQCDCVVGLGVLVAGDTNHHEMVGQSVSQALQTIAIETRTPVINGVIVANSNEQARERCIGRINRGAEFAHAALEMAALRRKFPR
jgi:6,7-dimethyl-8-ribityllumazine synthase